MFYIIYTVCGDIRARRDGSGNVTSPKLAGSEPCWQVSHTLFINLLYKGPAIPRQRHLAADGIRSRTLLAGFTYVIY